jgi:hypothetical protein
MEDEDGDGFATSYLGSKVPRHILDYGDASIISKIAMYRLRGPSQDRILAARTGISSDVDGLTVIQGY